MNRILLMLRTPDWVIVKGIVIFIFLIGLASCKNDLNPNQVRTKSGLIYEITRLGYGNKRVHRGSKVQLHQLCTYKSGRVIFSTRELGYPVIVNMGDGTTVKGVEEGLHGMKEGEIRKLIVPPNLSKRTIYPPELSPDSTLYYTIEIMEIRS